MEDLAGYSPGWSTHIHTTYRGYDIYSNPSTTRGGFEVLERRGRREPVKAADREAAGAE